MSHYVFIGYTTTSVVNLGVADCNAYEAEVIMGSIAAALEQLDMSRITEIRANNTDDRTFMYTKVCDKNWEKTHNDPNANP